MARPKRDANGVCTDYKCRYCGICERLNTEKCCRSVNKYQKKIAEWLGWCSMVAADVVGIDCSISALKKRRQALLDGLGEDDLYRVDTLVSNMKQTPGIKVRFMHDGVERSCFECVYCEKSLNEDPCRNCLGERSYSDKIYPSARNFQPKDRSKEIACKELSEKHRHVFDELLRDVDSSNISVCEVIAYMLEDLGAK